MSALRDQLRKIEESSGIQSMHEMFKLVKMLVDEIDPLPAEPAKSDKTKG